MLVEINRSKYFETYRYFFKHATQYEFKNRIQEAFLTAIVNNIASMVELAFRSIKASSRWNAASVTAISESGELTGITASLKNVSQWNKKSLELNENGETRWNIPDEVSELSVARTQFDW